MSKVSTTTELLATCLHDLADGERQASDRLPQIGATASDASLRRAVLGIGAEAGKFASSLEAWLDKLVSKPPSSPNIWMRGILDDAERDTETIEPGRQLDIAMIGAVRKCLAASIVSYETAVAVAASCDRQAIAEGINLIAADKRGRDQDLFELLQALSGATLHR